MQQQRSKDPVNVHDYKYYVSRIVHYTKLYHKIGLGRLILSSGMPRSGSTLLYNILRLCLEKKHGAELVSGWLDDFDNLPKGRVYLLKTHNTNLYYALRSQYVFYTYRDNYSIFV